MDVTREVVLDADVQDVWRALTDEGELSAWFGARVRLDPTLGGRGAFIDRGDGTSRMALVEAVDHERCFSFRWWPEHEADGTASTVTFTLEESSEGTRLTVVETAVDAKANAAWAARLVDLELLCLTLQLAPA